ncbi:hypothetical protein [Mesorhizobium muleiense]|uniref:deazapurine DNA modification protein DpdA family protein n=1 Tax=Mesorhizobium muleiense TaxID=1004279 RepID=UPI001F209056|nr:hypothetical protein [Mesorhizobium muleiense]MCF6112331.1 hypothetical protein [Mesorhizobium muleiense]
MTSKVRFYVGLHQPSDAQHFETVCISIRRLANRRKPIVGPAVLVDSGAFTEINLHGGYRASVEEYAVELHRLHSMGIVRIAAGVAQDYMCEPFMLAKTGLTVDDHQRLTIERYDALVAELDRLFDGECPFPVMPVLQGYAPPDYVRHVRMYGDRLKPGMWVGVGSVCKRNASPERIVEVLEAIKAIRPDLCLHGFGRNANSWQEAMAFAEKIEATSERQEVYWQLALPLGIAA